jgi:putative ABC transport system permease protein
LYGKRFTVIGVLKKEGAGLFGVVMIRPLIFQSILYVNCMEIIMILTNAIIIKPEKGVDMDAFKVNYLKN